MEVQPSLDFAEFQKALTEKRLLTFRIIAIALFLGVTFFLGIILLLYYQNSSKEISQQTSESGILPLLSIVHVCMACVSYLLAYLLPHFFVNPKRLAAATTFSPLMPPQPGMPMEVRACGLIFTGFILRAALMEGLALFGNIVCILGVLNGEIQANPAYWLNLFSYVIFAAVILWTFPTKNRLEDLFQRRFLQQQQVF